MCGDVDDDKIDYHGIYACQRFSGYEDSKQMLSKKILQLEKLKQVFETSLKENNLLGLRLN